MITESFQLTFNLKRERIDSKGLAPIYARITIQGKRTFISTKRKILLIDWDGIAGKAKSSNKNLIALNQFLEVFKSTIYNGYSELLLNKKRISVENIRKVLSGGNSKNHTILSIIRQHNEEFKDLIGVKYSYGSYKNYKSTLKIIEAFILKEYLVKDLPIEDLSYSFANGYYNYLVSREVCNHNGAIKQIQRLKKISFYAYKHGIITIKPLESMKLQAHPSTREVLDWKEILHLKDIQINNTTTAMVRDVFIFQCFTGLAYADVKKLTIDNISSGVDNKLWIFIERTKTRVRATIPILPHAAEALKKITSSKVIHKGQALIPIISNQKMNKHLKTIAVIASIKIPLSSHIARHTFATTVALSNGVPIETVSKILGHTNIRTTQIYAKVLENKVSSDMDKLELLLKKKNNNLL